MLGRPQSVRSNNNQQFHFLHDWYPGVCGSRFDLQRCLAQNDRFRPGSFFFIVICGSPNLIHLLFTSFANFLFGPGVQDLRADLREDFREDLRALRKPACKAREVYLSLFLKVDFRAGLRLDLRRDRDFRAGLRLDLRRDRGFLNFCTNAVIPPGGNF